MPATNTTPAATLRQNIGEQPCLAAEVADWEAEESCPLCSEPLNGEKFFHLECGKRENAEADRWEREGRAEMYETLGLGEV